MGERVIRVNCDRLLESLYCLQHPFFAVFIPEIAASQIEVVGLDIIGWLFVEADPLYTRELEFQTFRDSFRNLVLNRKNVGRAAIVLFAPKLRSIRNINQFAPDD